MARCRTRRSRRPSSATLWLKAPRTDCAVFACRTSPWTTPPVDDTQVTAETTGLTHYPILIPTTAEAPPVPGRLYPLTPADLTAADAYEGEAYRRLRVRTEAGAEAWVYVAAEG